MTWIPNSLSLINLALGFTAILVALHGEIGVAGTLVLIAMVMDLFDGKTARMIGKENPIGKELDSLADLVSFGLSPGFLLYTSFCMSFENYGNQPLYAHNPLFELNWSLWHINLVGLLLALIFPLLAAYRLARFNVFSVPGKFIGISTTLATGGIVMVITLPDLPFSYVPQINSWFSYIPQVALPWWLVLVLYLGFALTMISKFEYPKVGSLMSLGGPWYIWLMNIGFVVGIVVFAKFFLLSLFIIYFAYPLVFWKRVRLVEGEG